MRIAAALLLLGCSSTAGSDTADVTQASHDVTQAPPDVPASETHLAPADAAAPPPHLSGQIDAAGSFRVGFRSESVTYTPSAVTDGDEPLVLPERTLSVSVWYPASSTVGDPATYTLGITRPNIHTGAAPLDARELPVLVYSHGHQGFAEASFFLTEHFASHGFIVVAPNHTGNTFIDSPTRTVDSYLVRPLDVAAVLDWLYGLPPSDPLAGRASDVVTLTGHSYGGFTALAAAGGVWSIDAAVESCATGWDSPFCDGLDAAHIAAFRHGLRDPRIDAVVTMAAGDAFAFTPDGLAGLEVPTLLITGGRDAASRDAMSGDLLWTALPLGDRFARLSLPNAGHLTFTDTCEVVGQISEGDGCDGPPFVVPSEAHYAINTYATAFVRGHLYADPAGLEVLAGTRYVVPPGVAALTIR